MKPLLPRSVSDGSEEAKDSNDTQVVYSLRVAVTLRLNSSATCSVFLCPEHRQRASLLSANTKRLLLAQLCGTHKVTAYLLPKPVGFTSAHMGKYLNSRKAATNFSPRWPCLNFAITCSLATSRLNMLLT